MRLFLGKPAVTFFGTTRLKGPARNNAGHNRLTWRTAWCRWRYDPSQGKALPAPAPPLEERNSDAITHWFSIRSAGLPNRSLRSAGSKRRKLSGRRALCATRPARWRGRISAESLLQGNWLPDGGLRFRIWRLGTGVVNDTAKDHKVDARLQLWPCRSRV